MCISEATKALTGEQQNKAQLHAGVVLHGNLVRCRLCSGTTTAQPTAALPLQQPHRWRYCR
jgi:hypothetical protein